MPEIEVEVYGMTDELINTQDEDLAKIVEEEITTEWVAKAIFDKLYDERPCVMCWNSANCKDHIPEPFEFPGTTFPCGFGSPRYDDAVKIIRSILAEKFGFEQEGVLK